MTYLRIHISWLLIAFLLSGWHSFSQEKKLLSSESRLFLKDIELSDHQNIKPHILLDSIQHKGYLFAEIIQSGDSSKIKPGSKIKKIRLKYTDLNGENSTAEIPFKNLTASLQNLNQKWSDQGFPFNKVEIGKIKQIDDHKIQVSLTISKNQERMINDIVLKGYTSLPEKHIKRSLKVNKKAISQKELKAELDYLQEKLNFKLIDHPKILYKKNNSVLYIYTEKTGRNMFDGVLGFSNEDDSFKLSGDLELELNNNLNAGEKFTLNYKNTNTDQEIIRVDLTYPFLFNTRFDLETDLEIFRQDSSYTNTSFKAGLNYNINRTFNIKAGYRSRKSNALNEETNEDFSYNALRTSLGMQNEAIGKIELATEFGSRKTKESEQQSLLQLLYTKKVNFNETYNLLIQNENTALFSKTYLNNEVFKIGGIKSIRGFLENSISATKFSSIRLDHNFKLTKALDIIGITDYLFSYNNIDKIKTNYYSFGFGLALQQNNTNIRIIMANGFTDADNIDVNNTKIHIRLATFF
ncbi:MAG: hypothetical protein ACTHY4_10205 [Flavobacteriaceae bacterium]